MVKSQGQIVQEMLGAYAMQIAALQAENETLRARIAELETSHEREMPAAGPALVQPSRAS